MRSTCLGLAVLLGIGIGAANADDKVPGKKDLTETKPAALKSGAAAEVKAGTGVEKREVVGEASEFSKGSVVWAWSRVQNAEPNVKHVWKLDGKEVWSMSLAVGSKRWATYTHHTVRSAGKWQVDVQTESGETIGTTGFTVN